MVVSMATSAKSVHARTHIYTISTYNTEISYLRYAKCLCALLNSTCILIVLGWVLNRVNSDQIQKGVDDCLWVGVLL